MCQQSSLTSRSARLAAIREHVIALRQDAEFLDGEEASKTLAEATSLAAEVEALRLQLVTRIDVTEVWRDDPSGTANSWLRARHRVDHREAESDLRAAHILRAFPELRAAVEGGELTRAHINAIVSVGEANATRRQLLGEFIESFIEVGRMAPASVLRTVMRAWADQVDPLGTARDEDEAHSRRYLHVNQVADGVQLDAFFGRGQGAKVMAALNAAVTRSRRRSAEPDTDPSSSDSPGIVVTNAQQRADAFIAGIIDPVLADGGLPSSGGARPSVTVLVPISRLEQACDVATPAQELLGLSAAQLRLGAARIGVNNGHGDALISAQSAQRMTCDCEVHRVLISPDGLPLDVGRTMRTFPPHMRKALVVRDGGCVFPHCDRPPGYTEAHHIVHWAQGGKTSIDNAALLCSKHHHQVHADGHTVEIGPDGRARVLLRSTRLRQ